MAAAGDGVLRDRRAENGGTEAINLVIEKARRLAHGYRNFENYCLRMLLTASGTRRPASQDRDPMATLKSEEPY